MKLSQSFVAASLSVAVQSTTARANPESADLNILPPPALELPLDGPKPARTIARGFGRRAPPFLFRAARDDSPQAASRKSKRQAQAPPVSVAGAGALVSNVAEGLVGGLPVVGAPLSNVIGSLPLPGPNQPGSAVTDDTSVAPGTAGGLPVVGDAVAGILGSLPIDGIAQSAVDQATNVAGGRRTAEGPLSGAVGGQVSNLLGTAVGTLQGLPVVGDLAKSLPLDSLSQGDPLSNVINTASGVVSGLPAVGAPLAQTLNSAASLAQALPLSLAALPDNRAVAQPTYSYNQMSVTASMLGAAGGAFPIQPSRSLDGATLPNNINPTEEYQQSDKPQIVQSQQSSTDDDNSAHPQEASQVQSQEIKQDREHHHFSSSPTDSTQRLGTSNSPNIYKPTNPSTNYPITNALPPPTADSLPAKLSFKEVYASPENFHPKKIQRRSTQLPLPRGAGSSKFGFFSTLSAVRDSNMEERITFKETPIKTQKPSGNLKSWWKRRVSKIAKQ